MKVVPALAALSAVAMPLAAQTQVDVRMPARAEFGQITLRRVSEVDIRRLYEEIQTLIAGNQRRQAALLSIVRDSTRMSQVAHLRDELERVTFEILSKESELHVACLVARPLDDIPGTLGIDVDVDGGGGIRWTHEAGGGTGATLTMMFGDTPPRVRAIAPGSPAERAGMRVGDVWTSINGRPLVGAVRFDELLNPGTTVALRVVRAGRAVELPVVTVAEKPREVPAYPTEVCNAAQIRGPRSPLVERMAAAAGQGGGAVRPVTGAIVATPRPGAERVVAGGTAPVAGQLFVFTSPTMALYAGATLQAVDDEWRTRLGIKGDGLIVVDVSAGTPAATAGLKRFDVITRVNGAPVATPVAFRQASAAQRVLELLVSAGDGATRTVRIER